MNDITKAEKLKHYATRDLTSFCQYDGFYMPEGGDDIMHPDEDMHCIIAGETQELMTGVYEVRVLITDGADKEQAVAMLKKILDWIENGDIYPLQKDVDVLLDLANNPPEPVTDKSEDEVWQEYLDSTKDDWNSAVNGPIPF